MFVFIIMNLAEDHLNLFLLLSLLKTVLKDLFLLNLRGFWKGITNRLDNLVHLLLRVVVDLGEDLFAVLVLEIPVDGCLLVLLVLELLVECVEFVEDQVNLKLLVRVSLVA